MADEKAGVAACVGARWIGGEVAGMTELLARCLHNGGIILIGAPSWWRLPPSERIAVGSNAGSPADFPMLPERVASFGNLGYDIVEMVMANQDSRDRSEAAWSLTMRQWLDDHPDAAYTRDDLGRGVFALMAW